MAQVAGKASNLQRWQDSIARGQFPKTLYVRAEKSWKCVKRAHTREHTLGQVELRVWEREFQLCYSICLVFDSRPGIAGLICSKSKHGRHFQKFKRNACCQAYPSLPARHLSSNVWKSQGDWNRRKIFQVQEGGLNKGGSSASKHWGILKDSSEDQQVRSIWTKFLHYCIFRAYLSKAIKADGIIIPKVVRILEMVCLLNIHNKHTALCCA